MPEPAKRLTRRAAVAGIVTSCALSRVAFSAQARSLKEFGAVGSGTSDDSDALERAFTRTLGDLYVPKGIYRFSQPIVVTGGPRRIVFEEGTILRGITPQKAGLFVQNGNGIQIENISVDWEMQPRDRMRTGGGVLVYDSSDVVVRNARVSGSGAAGILFSNCIRPRVERAYIENTMADGLHFANCQDPVAIGITTQNTGDDGLAFVNFGKMPDRTGGHASDISVTQSFARGIAVVGQANVNVERFNIKQTRVSGLYIAQEPGYATRFPKNVFFKDGRVEDAGSVPGPKANQYGIAIVRGENVRIQGVTVTNSVSRLADAYDSHGTLELIDVLLDNNGSGEGVHFTNCETVSLQRLTVRHSESVGVYVGKSRSLSCTGVTVEDVGRRGNMPAVYIEDIGSAQGDPITIKCSNPGQFAQRAVVERVGSGQIRTQLS